MRFTLVCLLSLIACSRPSPQPDPDGDCTPRTWYADWDGDGFGRPDSATEACAAPADHVDNGLDCDDERPRVNPDAAEICNGRDNDCNGEVDDGVQITAWTDVDGDGRGDPATAVEVCELSEGQVDNGEDCNDAEPLAWSGAVDACDGIDNDCDGDVDEDVETVVEFSDRDGDGLGDPDTARKTCAPDPERVDNGDDCNDRWAEIQTCDRVQDVSSGKIRVGTRVVLDHLVGNAPRLPGNLEVVQDPDGGPYSGIFVRYDPTDSSTVIYAGETVSLIGDLVETEAGLTVDVTVSGGAVLRSGGTVLLEPDEVPVEDLLDAGTAGQWHGVLVEVADLTVEAKRAPNLLVMEEGIVVRAGWAPGVYATTGIGDAFGSVVGLWQVFDSGPLLSIRGSSDVKP